MALKRAYLYSTVVKEKGTKKGEGKFFAKKALSFFFFDPPKVCDE
jgi:hypothetical protein